MTVQFKCCVFFTKDFAVAQQVKMRSVFQASIMLKYYGKRVKYQTVQKNLLIRYPQSYRAFSNHESYSKSPASNLTYSESVETLIHSLNATTSSKTITIDPNNYSMIKQYMKDQIAENAQQAQLRREEMDNIEGQLEFLRYRESRKGLYSKSRKPSAVSESALSDKMDEEYDKLKMQRDYHEVQQLRSDDIQYIDKNLAQHNQELESILSVIIFMNLQQSMELQKLDPNKSLDLENVDFYEEIDNFQESRENMMISTVTPLIKNYGNLNEDDIKRIVNDVLNERLKKEKLASIATDIAADEMKSSFRSLMQILIGAPSDGSLFINLFRNLFL